MDLSLEKQAIVEAYHRRYIITEEGEVVSPKNNIMSLFPNKKGYLEFSYRMKSGKKKNIKVHMYQAYHKFGDLSLMVDVVNHIDRNKLNNHYNNIQLSTLQEAYSRSTDTKKTNKLKN